jgi:SagB-type dehydrogenase family enzyme
MKSLFGLLDDIVSDQDQGKPAPPLQKPPEPGQELIDLPKPDASAIRKPDIHACLADRRSRRRFAPEGLSLAQLSYLLWATQGVHATVAGGKATLRTVPSGGARHPFETYLIVRNVASVEPGICRYLPLSHQLVRLTRQADLPEKTTAACNGQEFVGQAAAVFVWSCVPYRAEWRYHFRSHKAMLLDAGHVCQNLYLACEALGAGTCAVAAYDQRAMDELLGLDGQDEFVVYLAPVGWPA